MSVTAFLVQEEARLATLDALKITDTPPEAEYDDLVLAARALLDAPMAYLSFIDEGRLWFKSRMGFDLCETSREGTICGHTVLDELPLVVSDTSADPRFASSPFVTGPFGLRFYAGAPIVVDGHAVGTLCCVDTVPRVPSDLQVEALAALARQASALLRARRNAREFTRSERQFSAFLDHAPATAFLKDGAGRMRYVNRRFEAQFDRPADTVLGRTDYEWLPVDFADACAEDDATVVRTNGPIQIEEQVPLTEDTVQVWQTHKFPVEMDGETWVGGIALDVTALRMAEAKVREQNAALVEREARLTLALEEAESARTSAELAASRFSQLFSGLPVACFTYGESGTIHEWNAAAEALWGTPCEEALLAPVVGTVVGEANRKLQEATSQRVFAGETVHDEERWETMRDGSQRCLLTNTFPLRTPSGTIVGAVSANLDVTERKQAEEATREAKLFAESMADSATSMLYLVDFDTKTRVWSNHDMIEALGYDAEFLRASEGELLPCIVHPDDLARMTQTSEELRDANDHQVVDFEVRFRHANGGWRWLWHRETIHKRKPDGSPALIMGSAQDVTDRKRMEAELRESEARFRTVVTSLHEGLMVQDPEGHVLLWNPSATRITGFDFNERDASDRRDLGWRLYREDGTELGRKEYPAALTLRTGESCTNVVVGVQRADDRLRWISVNSTPLARNEDGSATEVVSSFVDVTERMAQERRIQEQIVQINEYSSTLETQKSNLEKANARLENLATTDGLTGLKNHRYFQEWLRRKVDECTETGMPLSIALIDVDRFKAYNDGFGHQAGDMVLRSVANALERTRRANDLVARYGGEEFVIVMPQANEAESLELAECIRAAVADLPFPDRMVTASFGVATLDATLLDAPSIIRAADEALYRSKDGGRDRVTHYRSLVRVPEAPSIVGKVRLGS